MRLIFAALLGAAASLPALVHATITIADPTDAAASVPAISARSAFDGYRPYNDAANPTWQQLNQAVQAKPAKGGMNKPVGDHQSVHSQHGKPAK
ncbi:hypothetical protein LJR230_001146 [Trinickia sp. LjRoot230]|uniref:hypothetical protein n=1 Tax=Trinickia sp. LjRoot230 TaxID=3342288 RepID=UPI003ECC895B